MNTDTYLMKRFNKDTYNCWHFVHEVWRDLTGTDLSTPNPSVESIAPHMQQIDIPESPCIVLMLRARCTPHVGVYYKGRVLHMNARGAEYGALDSVTASFPTVRFYK